eukprot:TRINITY_DN71579_c0_g1_i1.p1 TRINITY_DN71579_c0_g1~~TRINITY_DN71579_c0_g1_i1.p1  ORF type:complete len:227 (-),score=28.18 TRINITY_DN71579_c0_g1_i1:308-988(-)
MDTVFQGAPVTRMLLVGCFLVNALCVFELAGPLTFYRSYSLAFEYGQIWRLVTCFLFAGNVFSARILLFFFHFAFISRRIEQHFYHGRSSEYFMHTFYGMLLIHLITCRSGKLFFTESLLMMLLYLWSRRSPDEHLLLWGIVPISAPFLPFVILVLDLMLGGSVLLDVIGIFVGHVLWIASDVFPQDPMGFNVLYTPNFVKWAFGELRMENEIHEDGTDVVVAEQN